MRANKGQPQNRDIQHHSPGAGGCCVTEFPHPVWLGIQEDVADQAIQQLLEQVEQQEDDEYKTYRRQIAAYVQIVADVAVGTAGDEKGYRAQEEALEDHECAEQGFVSGDFFEQTQAVAYVEYIA
jgi:hypothetical protein